MSGNLNRPNSAYYLLNSYRLYLLLEQTYKEYGRFRSLCDRLAKQRNISIEAVLKMFVNTLTHCKDIASRSDYDNSFRESQYVPPTEDVRAICIGVVLKEFMQKQNGRYRSLFTLQEQKTLEKVKLKKNKPSLVCYDKNLSKNLKEILDSEN